MLLASLSCIVEYIYTGVLDLTEAKRETFTDEIQTFTKHLYYKGNIELTSNTNKARFQNNMHTFFEKDRYAQYFFMWCKQKVMHT